MNFLYGSYPAPIAMLHRNVTPPLPNTEYVPKMLSVLKNSIKIVANSKIEFENYFKIALPKEGKIAPKEFENAYKQLDEFGSSFIKCVDEFVSLIEPTIKTTVDLNSKRADLAKSLDEYQKKIVIVRKEMTEANIAAEGEKLQTFANNMAEFNKESNDYKHCLLKLYLSACFQLEQGITSALHILNKAIDNPEEISITKEEKELDDYIQQLNEEIAVKNENERKAKEAAEAAQKAEKEKLEKEKLEKEKAAKEAKEEANEKQEEKQKDIEEKEEAKEVKEEAEEEKLEASKEEENQQKEDNSKEDDSKEDNEKESDKSEHSNEEKSDDSQKETEN